MGDYIRKWPKLEPGQQIRIRNKLTGEYVFKPKGSSSGWRWSDTKQTVWDNFTGPGHILGQFTKYGMNKDNKSQLRYQTRSFQVLACGIDNVDIEIVELTTVKVINAAEQYEQRKLALEQEQVQRNTRSLLTHGPSEIINKLVRVKGETWLREFIFENKIFGHYDIQSFNVGRLTILQNELPALEKYILESL